MTAAPAPVLCTGIGSGATVVANLEPNFVDELHEAVRSLPHDIGVQSRVAHGAAARCILEVAEECGCDLIVMGFHGHGRITLRGSVSDTVARESPARAATRARRRPRAGADAGALPHRAGRTHEAQSAAPAGLSRDTAQSTPERARSGRETAARPA